MAKYRLLTKEELNELEKEFIQSLIVNGITAEDWDKLKKEDSSSAENIIDLFSDVVFESIFRKAEYLECRTPKEIMTYQCLAGKMVIVGLRGDSPDVDFTRPEYIQQAMLNPPERLKVFTAEKEYTVQREIELFRMTESGCTISDGKLFKTLCLSLPDKN